MSEPDGVTAHTFAMKAAQVISELDRAEPEFDIDNITVTKSHVSVGDCTKRSRASEAVKALPPSLQELGKPTGFGDSGQEQEGTTGSFGVFVSGGK